MNQAAPPTVDDTSSSLLARVKNQNADAWLQLATWVGPYILGWCRRAGLQAADCDDVSQQVLTNVWHGLAKFRADQAGQSFRGWVYVITRNCVADLRERRRREQALDRLAVPRPAATPERELPAEDDPAAAPFWKRRALQLLLKEIITRHAEDRGFKAFYRTAVDGLTAPEVAGEIGMSADVVRQHKCRWIKRLRDRLREQFGELLD